MSIHDLDIANQVFPAFRSDLNNALKALGSNSSHDTGPTTSYEHQFWADITTGGNTTLKIRNKANNAWVNVGIINETTNTFQGSDATTATTATNTNNVKIISNSDNADRYLSFVTSTTAGNYPLLVDPELKYNPNTNTLTVTSFKGALDGNASTATTAITATNADNLKVVLDTDTATNVERPLLFTDNTTAGNKIAYMDAGVTYNAQQDRLTATTFKGNLDGNANTASSALTAGSAESATNATNAAKLYVTSEPTTNFNGTVYLLYSQAIGSNQVVYADTGITYNPSTNKLAVDISGNAHTATTAGSANTAGSAGTASSAESAGKATKVAITADTDTDVATERNVCFVNATTGDLDVLVDSGLTYNPGNNKLTASIFKGALDGNAATATSAGSAGTANSAENATNASKIALTAENTGSTARYLIFSGGATGNQELYSDVDLSYTPGPANGGGTLTVTKLKATGDILSEGDVTSHSDERLKESWAPLNENLVEAMTKLKYGTYTKIGKSERLVGVSAQSLREILPEAVAETESGYLAIKYGNAALVLCIELAKEISELKKRLAV